MKHKDIEKLAKHYITGSSKGVSNPRLQEILTRLMTDLFKAIEDLDISEDELWTGIDLLEEAGKREEIKLMVAGLGLDRFMDIKLEETEARFGIGGGTPRTIEGPLYVHGAPVCEGHARLDDDAPCAGDGCEVLFMEGVVRHVNGEPLPGATVEVWHADTRGNYSYFDKTQPDYHMRRTIIADENGRYSFRSIVPAGYGVPADGMTQKMLDQLGRHGQRPPHIHFFVHSRGFRKLTTQINLEGSKYTHDDYAFADRIGLVPKLRRVSGEDELAELGLAEYGIEEPCAYIYFDFRLHPEVEGAPPSEVERRRARDYLSE